MSVDETLAAILAETDRRKDIWKKLETIAQKAVKAIQGQAKKRGVSGTDWMHDAFWGEHCYLVFEGKNGTKKDRELAIFVSPNGTIGRSKGECDDNIMHEGFPDLSDTAPERFEKAVVEALLESLFTYCREQGKK